MLPGDVVVADGVARARGAVVEGGGDGVRDGVPRNSGRAAVGAGDDGQAAEHVVERLPLGDPARLLAEHVRDLDGAHRKLLAACGDGGRVLREARPDVGVRRGIAGVGALPGREVRAEDDHPRGAGGPCRAGDPDGSVDELPGEVVVDGVGQGAAVVGAEAVHHEVGAGGDVGVGGVAGCVRVEVPVGDPRGQGGDRRRPRCDHHRVAGRTEPVGDGGTEEPGAADDKCVHASPPPSRPAGTF